MSTPLDGSVDDPEYIAALLGEDAPDLPLDFRSRDGRPSGEFVLPDPVDWHKLFARVADAEWLVEHLWPAGRQLHIFAPRKVGKSLVMLWIAANLAVGRDPFTGVARPPIRVVYLDYEMTEDDLLERLEEMGFEEHELDGRFTYYLWPTLPPLDTDVGGRTLMALLERDRGEAVVIDTLSRVVEGEENSADTYRGFFMFTGMRLKRAGIPMARLDHEGHESGRSRGSSAKGDDVDVVWRLQRSDDGLTFTRKAARMSWVPERVQLRQGSTLSFELISDSWPAGTRAIADELDRLGIARDVSRRAARAAMKAADVKASSEVLSAALRFRRSTLIELP